MAKIYLKILVSILIFAGTVSSAAAEPSWKMRAREGLGWGDVSLGDGRGGLSFNGLHFALNLWREDPKRYSYGATFHRGRLRRTGSSKEALVQTTVGLEGKWFPMENPFFLRGGLLAEALDPAGPVKDVWLYGFLGALGIEFPIRSVGLSLEGGGRVLWGARGRYHRAPYVAIGLHFYLGDSGS